MPWTNTMAGLGWSARSGRYRSIGPWRSGSRGSMSRTNGARRGGVGMAFRVRGPTGVAGPRTGHGSRLPPRLFQPDQPRPGVYVSSRVTPALVRPATWSWVLYTPRPGSPVNAPARLSQPDQPVPGVYTFRTY